MSAYEDQKASVVSHLIHRVYEAQKALDTIAMKPESQRNDKLEEHFKEQRTAAYALMEQISTLEEVKT